LRHSGKTRLPGRHVARRLVASPAVFAQKAPAQHRRTQLMTSGYCFEDLEVGQSASLAKTITEADILMYAAVSMDTNPVHIDAEAAKASVFGERIAHGMLSAGLISALLGTRLPGPGTLYMRQSLRFAAPVKIGATVKATVTVASLNPEKKRATLSTVCTVDGEAYVQVPSRG
jgi:3-hydroxybutyryl-CoA dehydratase